MTEEAVLNWVEKQTPHELEIVAKVAEIVARGNVARFERSHHDFDMQIVKHVSTTERNELGDLIGSWSNGSTRFVAAWDKSYKLTEVTQEEATKERGPGPYDPNIIKITAIVI